MILLGENTDGLIASELLKPSQGTNHRFLRRAAKGNGNPFPENGTGCRFPGFQQVDLPQTLLQKKL